MTLLGLYKDDVAPLASNFAQSAKRQFHTHKIDHFSSNVALVLYKCEAGPTNENSPPGIEWPGTLSDHMVQMFVQELPVPIPGSELNLMPFEQFKQKYSNSVDSCNFNEICKNQVVDPQSNGNSCARLTFNLFLVAFSVICVGVNLLFGY